MKTPPQLTIPGRPQPEEPKSGKGRRILLGSVAASAAVLAVMLATKNEDTAKEISEKVPTPVTKELPPQQPPQKKLESPELPVNTDILIPQLEITTDSSPSKIPNNLHVTQEEFVIISDRIASMITVNIKERLAPHLREHPETLQDAIRQTIQQAAEAIQMADPRAHEEMMNFNQAWLQDPNPVTLMAHINEYLEPSGWYFDFRVTENAELYLNYLPIQKRGKVTVKEGTASHEVPVRYLGKPAISHPSYRSSSENFASINESLTGVNVFIDGLDETRKEFLHDTVVNQATAIFLARKFPKAATILEKGRRFHMSLAAKGGNGNDVNLTGFYPPVMFHAIAGIGSQLANSDQPTPDVHAAYLIDLSAMPPEQALMGKILPLVTLQTAPDSPAKQELIATFQSNGNINFEKLKALMFTPPYTMEHSKKAGEVLYRFAYMVFEAIEKGQFTEMGK